MIIDPVRVAEILGGPRVLRQRVRTLADLNAVVAAGLPIASLDAAAAHVAGSTGSAAALKHRLVPRPTRARRTRLKVVESERVERLARVMALAEAVWENEEDARAFMHEPHPLLEERSPLDVAATELGARRVEELLAKLEYSLPV
jgi:putative toxin-antitoxin system antitoxin component (TIGR02293 family)